MVRQAADSHIRVELDGIGSALDIVVGVCTVCAAYNSVRERRRRLPLGDGRRRLALGCDRTWPALALTVDRRTLLGAIHRAQVFARSHHRRFVCVMWPYAARTYFYYLKNVSPAHTVRLAESFPLAPFRFLRLVFPSFCALTPCVLYSGSSRTTAARRVASPFCTPPLGALPTGHEFNISNLSSGAVGSVYRELDEHQARTRQHRG
jgi:hypothetical protein